MPPWVARSVLCLREGVQGRVAAGGRRRGAEVEGVVPHGKREAVVQRTTAGCTDKQDEFVKHACGPQWRKSDFTRENKKKKGKKTHTQKEIKKGEGEGEKLLEFERDGSLSLIIKAF